MEGDPTQKQKGQGKGQKKNIDKGEDKLFLLGNINSNVNVFSQLSSMYQAQTDDTAASFTSSTSSDDSSKKPGAKYDPVYQAFLQSQKEFDFDITKILNKLNKKSDTTKLRALSELKAVLSERDENFYKTFFPTWLYIYKQLVSSEFDKKILEECNGILLIMAPKLKKNLAPYIKDLFPLWFLSMNDPNNEAAFVANKAFEQTFPQNKHAVVLTTCAENLIAHIESTFRLTPQKVLEENGSLDETQSEEVYDRLILSCLSAVTAALKINASAANPADFINRVVSLFSLDQQLKGNSIILTFLHNKKRPRIRAGAIELIDSLLNYVDPKVFQPNLASLTNMLLDLLDDKERSVQRALWKDSLIRVMKTAAADSAASEKVEIRKYENKILYAIKNAGSGLGSLLFNRLVEFFAYCESFSKKDFAGTGEKIEDRIGFYRKFFNHIVQAYNHEEVRFFGNELTNSYFECALFCIIKRILPLAEQAKSNPPKNPEATKKTLRGFIKEILITPCQEYLKKYSKTSALSPYKNIATRLGDTLDHIEVKPELQEEQLFADFEKEFRNLFEQSVKSADELDNYFSLLQGCIRIKKESALYSYFQELITKCNQYFQDEVKTSFLSEEAVVSDSLLEKKFEDLQKMEKFNTIFVSDPSILKDNAIYSSLIEGNFSNLVELTKKFLASFNKVIKVANVERFAKFTMKTINNMLFLYDQAGSQKEALEAKLDNLLKCLSDNLNNTLNIHNLLLISFLFNPAALDNYFSEFVSYNNNKSLEDMLLNRALESYIKKSKDEKAFHFSKTDNQAIQDLIKAFAVKVLRSEQYRMFGPSICHVLLFSAQEKTIQEVIKAISEFLKELATNKGKLSVEFDKLDPLFSSLAILIKARSLSTIEAADLELCFHYLIKILTSLYSGGGTSRKRALVVYDLLKRVNPGEKLKQDSNFKGLREYIIRTLHDALLAQLTTNFTKKEAKDKLKLENLVKMVEDYLKFVTESGATKHLSKFYEDFLNEKFFETSMVTPDVWRILMTCFETTSNELKTKDVFHIKHEGKLDSKFFWLVIEMISVVNSNSLLLSPREKRFFTTLSNDFFIHELLTDMEGNNEENLHKILEFLDYSLQQSLEKSLIYTLGIKKLLKTYVANSKDLSLMGRIFDSLLVKNLKAIASEVSKPEANTAKLFQRAIVHKNLLPVFEKFIPENQEKWAEASQSFQDNILADIKKPNPDYAQLTSLLINLDVFGSMVALNPKLMVEDQTLDEIVKYIFKHIKIEDLRQGKLEPNFTLNTLFELINLVIETKTFTPLSDYILQIEKFFLFGLEYNSAPKNYSSSALIKINMFIRKVLSYFEIFSEGFKELAFDGILRTCKSKTQEVSKQNTDAPIDEELRLNNEINEIMLTEFAETIARMTIACDQSLDEALMYSLFDCHIPAIQKSAFILIKHFYENFALKLRVNVVEEKLEEDKEYLNQLFTNEEFVPVSMEETIKDYYQKEKELLQVEEDAFDEEDEEDLGEKFLLNSKNHGLLLTWISLLLKLKLQIANSAAEVENIYKRAFINYFNQRPETYSGVLDIVFTWLKTLNFNLSQQRDIINSKEYELGNLSLEWEDFSSFEGLFRIILQFIYLFIVRFPKFFRKWYENTVKANKKEVESLIKSFISNTLFNEEKSLIENKTYDWKSEEFNIFVMKSTRQILASYMKENSKLEIAITVPDDYPLSPIQIERQKGVKISENKLNKYTLMMRTILVNENNTFLSALMLWKNNIEKEFEGVEECAICYYVVHSSTKDLPKLACKTCKHKFHSVCIHKWFESSNKSECPLCKSQFW